MRNLTKYWIPSGDLTQGQAEALAVPTQTKPAEFSIYQHQLISKLQNLIDHSKTEAKDALEMSIEHLPEMYQIAKDRFPKEWAVSMVYSDTMHNLISRIDWTKAGQVIELEEQSLQKILEQMP